MPESNRWKEHFLKSGLPLEHAVRTTLEQHGISYPNEYRYTRPNEQGVLTEFSVDVAAAKTYLSHGIGLNLLVECKYRHDSVKWLFTPDRYDFLLGEFSDLFIAFDALSRERQANTAELNAFAELYPLCRRGIEITSSDANPKSIEQALQQLRFAVVNTLIERMRWRLSPYGSSHHPDVTFVIPVIVTTAELWRMNPEIDIRDVRNADHLHEVATEEEVLVIHETPNNELRGYNLKRLEDSFPSGPQRAALEAAFSGHGTVDDLFRRTASFYPSMFLVISYRRFNQAVERVFSFFDRASLVQEREPQAVGADDDLPF